MNSPLQPAPPFSPPFPLAHSLKLSTAPAFTSSVLRERQTDRPRQAPGRAAPRRPRAPSPVPAEQQIPDHGGGGGGGGSGKGGRTLLAPARCLARPGCGTGSGAGVSSASQQRSRSGGGGERTNPPREPAMRRSRLPPPPQPR